MCGKSVHGLDFGFFGSGLLLPPSVSGANFFVVAGSGLALDFAFVEKILLVVCLTYIYAESNKSRITCVILVPNPEGIRIENLQNKIGSGLKKSESVYL